MDPLYSWSHGNRAPWFAGLVKLEFFGFASANGSQSSCVRLRMPETLNNKYTYFFYAESKRTMHEREQVIRFWAYVDINLTSLLQGIRITFKD